jgi:hypothetical protein
MDRIEVRKGSQSLNTFQTQMKERAEAILRENALEAQLVFCAPYGLNALRQGTFTSLLSSF